MPHNQSSRSSHSRALDFVEYVIPESEPLLPHGGQATFRLLEIVGKNFSKTCPLGHLYSYVGIG